MRSLSTKPRMVCAGPPNPCVMVAGPCLTCCQPSLPAVLKQGYREDDGLYVESDTDEQLLINIPCESNQCQPGCRKDLQQHKLCCTAICVFVSQPSTRSSKLVVYSMLPHPYL